MPRQLTLPKPLWILLVIVAVGFQVWKEWDKSPSAAPSSSPTTQSTPVKQGVYEALTGARLQEDRNNDGDSFKVQHNSQVHELRLYFADCPEKRRHQYNGDRLWEQGQYFGGLAEAQTIAIGLRAKAYAEKLLSAQPFTVFTKWQSVYDSERDYAFVIFPDGQDLSEKLVREGLARIHTTGATLPDGRTPSDYQKHLRRLEAEAKVAHRGAWAQ